MPFWNFDDYPHKNTKHFQYPRGKKHFFCPFQNDMSSLEVMISLTFITVDFKLLMNHVD